MTIQAFFKTQEVDSGKPSVNFLLAPLAVPRLINRLITQARTIVRNLDLTALVSAPLSLKSQMAARRALSNMSGQIVDDAKSAMLQARSQRDFLRKDKLMALQNISISQII